MKRLLFTFFTIAFLSGPLFAQVSTTPTSWEGSVGKYPASIWLIRTDSLLYGEITYKRSGKPIQIRGKIDQGKYELDEFDNRGNITGSFLLTPTLNQFKGDWLHPSKDIVLHVTFAFKTTLPNSSVHIRSKPIDGTYEYSYGKESAKGSLTIKRQEKNKVQYSISSVTAAPSYHLADGQGITKLQGDRLTSQMKNEDGDPLDCSVNIRFIWDIAVVTQVLNTKDSPFGIGASVEGVYLKTKP